MEFDNEKNSCGSKIPLPPHNISNGPFLRFPKRVYMCSFLYKAYFEVGG